MKLLLNGKKRNIYFRKNNTAYYKSKNNEIDITTFFKKKGGLKKQYINLLVENEKKMIIGGSFSFPLDSSIIFPTNIKIKKSNKGQDSKTIYKAWNTDTIRDIYKKLLYVLLICKIHYNSNNELFKDVFVPSKKSSNTIKIKVILQILFGNEFNMYISNLNSDYTRITSTQNICGISTMKIKLTDDAIFPINHNYSPNDDIYYATTIKNISFRNILDKITFINGFSLNLYTSKHYKDVLKESSDNSRGTNLDLLKIIMINEQLFSKDFDFNINDEKQCEKTKFLDNLRENYLKMFKYEKLNMDNEINVTRTLIDETNTKINDLKTRDYSTYNTLWRQQIKDTIPDDKLRQFLDINNVNSPIYNVEYKKLYTQHKDYASKISTDLNTLMTSINDSSTLTETIQQQCLLKINKIREYILKDNANAELLNETIFSEIIKFYFNEINETIGIKLTTYLSMRSDKFTAANTIINTITANKDNKDKKDVTLKGGNKYEGLNEIFGTIAGNVIKAADDNEKKFEKMKNLFNKLIISPLAILIFGYGYSGSGKTYTLFGASDNNGITQRAIEYLQSTKHITQLDGTTTTSTSTVTIEAIYELYNDTYNILNAVSGERNPYDPLTKGSVINKYIPGINDPKSNVAKNDRLRMYQYVDKVVDNGFYNPMKMYNEDKVEVVNVNTTPVVTVTYPDKSTSGRKRGGAPKLDSSGVKVPPPGRVNSGPRSSGVNVPPPGRVNSGPRSSGVNVPQPKQSSRPSSAIYQSPQDRKKSQEEEDVKKEQEKKQKDYALNAELSRQQILETQKKKAAEKKEKQEAADEAQAKIKADKHAIDFPDNIGINPSNSIYVYIPINDDNNNIGIYGPYSHVDFQQYKTAFKTTNIVHEFDTIYKKIEEKRKEKDHIMPTANNKESSRGHLFIDLKIKTGDIESYLTICDMGGRENPNDLLLKTKIYNIRYGNKNDKRYSPTITKPYIISKDEAEMYTFDGGSKTTNKKMPIIQIKQDSTLTIKLNKIKSENIDFRSPDYPGILQLYKNYYAPPSLIEYFYFVFSTKPNDYYRFYNIGTGKSDMIQGMFSDMNPGEPDSMLPYFYKSFFKCIKQGFYINDSINQLLEKFKANPVVTSPDIIDLIYEPSEPSESKCKIQNIKSLYIPPPPNSFNNYGWYTTSLPKNCVETSLYDGLNEIQFSKGYKHSILQYDPIKPSEAIRTVNNEQNLYGKNIAIASIYTSFGANIPIDRKYVVIGCIRDEDMFIDDDELTLTFLKTVGTSEDTNISLD